MMYGKYVDGAAEITKEAPAGQTENGTETEATGTDLSEWITYDPVNGVSFSVADAAAPQAEEPAEQEEIQLAGRRVLVVEDIPENAEIVMDLLELEDVETEHAENGEIALNLFRESEERYYDAVLMDLRMPVMDGLEATRKIRALPREDAKRVPILALTANTFDSDIRAALDAGMNAHLAKPADADLLYATLKKCIKEAYSRKGDACLD
jgi:CheY-like chemotaxis protein